MKTNLAADRLRELFAYSPETGLFTRIVSTASRSRAGSTAGSLTAKGYLVIRVDGTTYQAHRLAWLYVNERWPDGDIDHKNGNRADNRISNLRACSRAENMQNQSKRGKGRSGLIGAMFRSNRRRWVARIKSAGRVITIGSYTSPDEAHAAYCEAKAKLHEFNPLLRDAT